MITIIGERTNRFWVAETKERKVPESTHALIETRQDPIEPENPQFKSDSNLNPFFCVTRKKDQRIKDEVASLNLELLFR